MGGAAVAPCVDKVTAVGMTRWPTSWLGGRRDTFIIIDMQSITLSSTRIATLMSGRLEVADQACAFSYLPPPGREQAKLILEKRLLSGVPSASSMACALQTFGLCPSLKGVTPTFALAVVSFRDGALDDEGACPVFTAYTADLFMKGRSLSTMRPSCSSGMSWAARTASTDGSVLSKNLCRTNSSPTPALLAISRSHDGFS